MTWESDAGRIAAKIRNKKDGIDMPDSHPALSILAQAGSITLEWEWPKEATRVVLDAMSPEFNFFPYREFTGKEQRHLVIRGEELFEYVQFRVRYFINDRYVYETDAVWNPYRRSSIDDIGFHACWSYNGICIGFRCRKIYGLFRLYEVVDGRFDFIAETEDFQIASPVFELGKKYYVEGYVKDEGTDVFTLGGLSDFWELAIDEFVCAKPVVSVVVPCFNIEMLLPRFLDSVMLQSMPGIEVIAVDDASMDGTPDVLSWYAEHYPYVCIITHDKNAYVTAARNNGIRAADTEFVVLADADDMLHYDMCRSMYEAMNSTGADVAICRIVVNTDFHKHDIILNRRGSAPVEVFTYSEMQDLQCKVGNIYFVTSWARMYRKSLMEKVYFPDEEHGYRPRQMYEDMGYTAAVYSYAERITMVHDTWYVWEKRHRQIVDSLSELVLSFERSNTAEAWQQWMESIFFFPFRVGCHERMSLLQYKQSQEVARNYGRLRCWENSTESQKVVIRMFQDGIREFNLMKNPYVMKDPKLLVTMMQAMKIKV